MRLITLPSRRGWQISGLLVGVGLALSAYMLARHFTLLVAPGSLSPDWCSKLFAGGCDGALSDERFSVLGVPLPGWGLVYFTSLGGLLLLARFMRGAFEREALLAAILMSVLGLGIGSTLLALAASDSRALCPLCLSVHATSLLLVFTLWRASARPFGEQVRLLRAAAEWFLPSRTETPEPTRWKLVGFGCVALLAVVVYQWVYVEAALRRPGEARTPDRAEIIAAYQASPRLALPVTEDDPHIGPLTAPVRLVVFESFRCSGCQRFAVTLSRLRNQFRDRLLVVYKHYPLSTECNSRLPRDMQPGACEIAWAAQAAHRQARFWPFHDALLAAGTDPSPQIIAETARRLNLDPARFAADRQSSSTKEQVAEDIALGNRLEIPGTPTVFLDGHLVSSAGPRILETLIRHELEQRSEAPRQGRDIMGLGRREHARPSDDG